MASNKTPAAVQPSLFNPFSLDDVLAILGGPDDEGLFESAEAVETDAPETIPDTSPAAIPATPPAPPPASSAEKTEVASQKALESASEILPAPLEAASLGSDSEVESDSEPSACVTSQPADLACDATDMAIDEFADLEALLNEAPAVLALEQGTAAKADASLENLPLPGALPLLQVSPAENCSDSGLPRQAMLPAPTSGCNARAEEAEPSFPPTKSYGTIRVDITRLDHVNNLVGELVTQENTAALQNQQLQSTIALTGQRFGLFEQLAKDMQDWIDQSQKSAASLPTGLSTLQRQAHRLAQRHSAGIVASAAAPAFDPLQMDSYSYLYTLVQSAMEEIAQQSEAMRDLLLISQQMQQTHQQKQQTLRQVRNSLLWVRMLPVGDILQRFPRMVRDMSAQCSKQVTVKLVGVDTLVDKLILEKLFDPLVHLVRNAVDHGIELPAVRESKGKPAQATLEIRAYHRGNQVYIDVQDDGRGIDVERIRARVVALNWTTTEQADELTHEQLYDYLFSPGFSTAAWVNQISGRGVGLDAVRVQVKNLKGHISLVSEPGRGTTFTMRLPLTMNVADLLVFSIQSNLMAIAADTLVSIVSVPMEQLQTQEGRQFYQWQDQLVPVHSQAPFLQHYPLPRHTNEAFQAIPLPQNHAMLLLIAAEAGVVALQVDQILQKQELVIKPFGSAVTPPPFLSGCTILGDGSLVPVIDGQSLLSESGPEAAVSAPPAAKLTVGPATSAGASPRSDQPASRQNVQPPAEPYYQTSAIPTLLVVDDSLTARQMLAFTLEKAGYRVVQARDGQDALQQLHQEPEIRAVLCDVEMPRMNGFEFLNHCFQEFPDPPPVIMVTSRAGDKHRQMAQNLGARSYLTKPYLEQSLLATLNQCLAAQA